MAQLRPFFFKIRSTNDSKAPQAGPEDCRRALAFIAGNADGYTRAVMLSHGFSLALTASLIDAGLATDRMPKRVGRGTVARVRITDTGRQALGGAGAVMRPNRNRRSPPIIGAGPCLRYRLLRCWRNGCISVHPLAAN